MNKIKLKIGDKIRVISGDHKGNEGEILKLFKYSNKALVSGINLVKRHTKPSAQNPQGGIVEKEAPLDLSNLSLLTSDGKTTMAGYKFENGKKIRFSKKTNEII